MEPNNEGRAGAVRPLCRRLHGLVTALAMGSALFHLPGCQGEARVYPDVVLITLDTTRADHLGVYGYERDITPEIDRLAEDAVVFQRAWSTASWTLPSHASIFTGKHPSSHGATFNVKSGDTTLGEVLLGRIFNEIKVNRLGEDQITLAELLQEAGYETAAFVGGPWMSPEFGLLQGYAVQDAEILTLGGRLADELTKRAIAWLQSIPREQPVHLLINYFDPHGPYEPPKGYDDLPRARAEIDVYTVDVIHGKPMTPVQRATIIDRYDGEIRFMDHHLGRIFEVLREVDRYEDALIIVLADHGETFGEHDLMEHGRWLYEEVLRVPLLIRFPGGRNSGTVVYDSVSVVDLLPLISREVGLTLPANTEGVPIGNRELVLAESSRDALSIRLWGPRFDRALISGIRWPWKLIMSDTGSSELYRLDDDPGELLNVADGEAEKSLMNAIEEARAAFKPPERSSSPESVSPETMKNLRGLGYIE